MSPQTRRNVLRYGIAIDLVILATGTGMLLPSPALLMLFFAAAVLVSVWKGGWQGGLTALLLSVLALATLFPVSATSLALFATATAVAGAAIAATMRSRVGTVPENAVASQEPAGLPSAAPQGVAAPQITGNQPATARDVEELARESARLEAERAEAERVRKEAAEQVARERELLEAARAETERARKEAEERVAREREEAERERARLEAEREALAKEAEKNAVGGLEPTAPPAPQQLAFFDRVAGWFRRDPRPRTVNLTTKRVGTNGTATKRPQPAPPPPVVIAFAAPKTAASDEYEVPCFTCRVHFNAVEADWCSCLAKERTFVCTNCLSCFCKAPPAFKEKFWVEAPPLLFERKTSEARRQQGGLPPNAPSAEVARPLVLTVEDDQEIQAIVHRVCTNLGYGFIHGANGEEGLSLAREYSPELILSDAFMPNLDGREMCRLLKEDPTTSRSKAVIMTGLYTDRKYRNEALDYFKVDDYVAKPLAVDDLIKLLKKHLPPEVATAH